MTPPLVTRTLLRWLLPRHAREIVLGDMAEEFATLARDFGERRARAWYHRMALRSVVACWRYGTASPGESDHTTWEGARGTTKMTGLWNDVRFSLRGLFRAPGFTMITIGTLALGIGATTALFAVINGVLLKPLAFEDPNELVGVWHTAPGLDIEEVTLSAAMALTYQGENRVFEDMGFWNGRQVSVTQIAEPEQVAALEVSAGLFPLLGVRPQIGRGFTERDDAPGSPQTVMLGEGYWRRRFGADQEVIGRTLRVDGVQREIIGVLPALHQLSAALYFPVQWASTDLGPSWSYRAVGRLRPEATIEAAQADVARMVPLIPERFPIFNIENVIQLAQLGPSVRPMKDDFVGDIGGVLWVLLGAAGIVLLIACANVANLFLVRTEGRHEELAVRVALGAGRTRIARQLMLESLVLGLLGGVVGVALGYGGVSLLTWMDPDDLPRLSEITIDATVLALWLGVSLLSALLFGSLSVLRAGWVAVPVALKGGGRGGTADIQRHRTRSALVVAQLALALVLLASSGLMIRSFQALRAVDPGFGNPEEVLAFRVVIPRTEVESDAEMLVALGEISDGLAAIPGVTSVGLSTSVTMDGTAFTTPMNVEEAPFAPGETLPTRRFKWVAGDYFQTMQNPVLVGSAIGWREVRADAPVAMVTANLAREIWGSLDGALGKRISSGGGDGGRWREIVGVVGDVHDRGVDQPVTAAVFLPLNSGNAVRAGVSFVVRVRGRDPRNVISEARAVVRSVNSNIPLAWVRTLDEILDESMARTSFALVLLGIAAALALLLGLVGIYAVMSYTVSQRTREIGVRMAVGADARDVRHMVLRQGLVLSGIGVVIGLAAAIGLARVMSSLLYGVEPSDPLTLGAVTIVLVSVALVACYVPAYRASRTDPLEALRVE